MCNIRSKGKQFFYSWWMGNIQINCKSTFSNLRWQPELHPKSLRLVKSSDSCHYRWYSLDKKENLLISLEFIQFSFFSSPCLVSSPKSLSTGEHNSWEKVQVRKLQMQFRQWDVSQIFSSTKPTELWGSEGKKTLKAVGRAEQTATSKSSQRGRL